MKDWSFTIILLGTMVVLITIGVHRDLATEARYNAAKERNTDVERAQAETKNPCSGITIKTIASPPEPPITVVLGNVTTEGIYENRFPGGDIVEVWRTDTPGGPQKIGEAWLPQGPICRGEN